MLSSSYYNSNKTKCEPNYAGDLSFLATCLYTLYVPIILQQGSNFEIHSMLLRWVTDGFGNNIIRSHRGNLKNVGIRIHKVIVRNMKHTVPLNVIENEPLLSIFEWNKEKESIYPYMNLDNINCSD